MKSHSSSSRYPDSNLDSMLNNQISLPLLHACDLNGNNWIIPHDLTAEKTLLFFAFKRKQQSSIDSWINGLGLRSSENKITWLEIPLLQKPWKLLSSWIDQGMKRGITDHELRGHVWTIYTNRDVFLKSLELTSTNSIYALVVSKDGTVLSLTSGEYNATAAQVVLKALQN